MTEQARDFVCSQCGGRSAVDAEYATLPAWACPFCSSVNPMPRARKAEEKSKPDRSKQIALLAGFAVVAIVVTSFVLQASNPLPPPRTVSGIMDALDRAGLPCVDAHAGPASPPARETGSCTLGGRPISILTFTGRDQRDRTIGTLPPGRHAAGETWIIRAPDARLAAVIARVLNGYVLEEE